MDKAIAPFLRREIVGAVFLVLAWNLFERLVSFLISLIVRDPDDSHTFIASIQRTLYFVDDEFDCKISSYLLACSGVFGPRSDCRRLPGEVSLASALKGTCQRSSEIEHACRARVACSDLCLLTIGFLV